MARQIARSVVLAVLSLAVLVGLLLGYSSWLSAAQVFAGRRIPPYDAVDFAEPYAAARLIASGDGHQIYQPLRILSVEPDRQGRADFPLVYLHPPVVASVLVPIARLPFNQAYQVWTVLNLLLLGVDCWLVWLIAEPFSKPARALILIGLLTLVPVSFNLLLGQFWTIGLFGWSGAYLFLRRGHERVAGIALSALVVSPQHLVPVVAFLIWKRKWRVLGSLVPVMLLAAAVSIAIVGPSEALRYPAFVLEYAAHNRYGMATDIMYGWNGLLGSVFGAGHPGLETLAAAPLALCTLFVAVLVWRGPIDVAGAEFPRKWLLLTAATALSDPSWFLPGTVILVPAAVGYLAADRWRRSAMAVAVLTTGWLLLNLGLFPNQYLHFSIFTAYVVAGFALVSAHAWGTTPAPAPYATASATALNEWDSGSTSHS